MNEILKDFRFHEGKSLESMKKGFQAEYEAVKNNKVMSVFVNTLPSFYEWIILFSAIFYIQIKTYIYPELLSMGLCAFFYQISWSARFGLQVKYFLTKDRV